MTKYQKLLVAGKETSIFCIHESGDPSHKNCLRMAGGIYTKSWAIRKAKKESSMGAHTVCALPIRGGKYYEVSHCLGVHENHEFLPGAICF